MITTWFEEQGIIKCTNENTDESLYENHACFIIGDIQKANRNSITELNAPINLRYSPESEKNKVNRSTYMNYRFSFVSIDGNRNVLSVYSEVFPGTWVESKNLIKSTTNDIVGLENSADSSPLFENLSTTYNGTAAADYAERWAMGYNALYHTLANDSTNFASQALKAGGWEEAGMPSQIGFRGSSYRWYYSNDFPFPSSYSWEDASYWQSFVDTTGRTERQESIHSLNLGDIIQYDPDSDGKADYTMVVTQSPRSGAKEYMVSYHGTRINALNMPFRSLQMLPGNFFFHKVVSTINLRGE